MPFKVSEANRASKHTWLWRRQEFSRLLSQSPPDEHPLLFEAKRRVKMAQRKAEKIWDSFIRDNLVSPRTRNRLRNAAYHAKHAEQIAQRKKPYRLKRADHYRALHQQWVAAHPEAIRLYSSARRARKRGLPDTFTLAEHQFMRDYWRHACAVCGNQEGFFWTLADDHWVCIASPHCPGTVADNMIPLCHGDGGCNNSKHDHDPQTWLVSRVGPARAKRILKAIETYFALVRARQAEAASAKCAAVQA